MNINSILGELRAERGRIDRAISAIEGLNSTGRRKVGRPPTVRRATRRRRGRMSAPGRAKQSQASKPVRRMSAAARRKMSRLLKQRWAQGEMKPRAKSAA